MVTFEAQKFFNYDEIQYLSFFLWSLVLLVSWLRNHSLTQGRVTETELAGVSRSHGSRATWSRVGPCGRAKQSGPWVWGPVARAHKRTLPGSRQWAGPLNLFEILCEMGS